MMIAWGCAVWGTRLVLPAVRRLRRLLPDLLPVLPDLRRTRAWYNPWTGTYGRSAVAYGPYGGVGVGARYNPRTGTYARGAAAYGPYGARGAGQAYNPRTGAYAQTRQGSNVYGSWGSTYVQRGDDWARTGARHQPQDRHDDERDTHGRRRRGPPQRAGRQRLRRGQRRQRLRGPRRQRVQAW